MGTLLTATLMKHTNCQVHMNDTLSEVCKMVQQAKKTLMHNRQELMLTYDEVGSGDQSEDSIISHLSEIKFCNGNRINIVITFSMFFFLLAHVTCNCH